MPTPVQIDQQTHIALLVIFAVLFIPGAILLILRRYSSLIHPRCYELVLLSLVFVLADMIVRTFYSFNLCPCVLITTESYLMVPASAYTYFIRAFVLWYQFSIQNTLLTVDMHIDAPTFTQKILLYIKSHSWIVSLKGQFLMYCLIFFTTVVIALLDYFLNAWGDCISHGVFLYIVSVSAIGLLIFAVFAYLLWVARDAYYIKYELIIAITFGLILLVLFAFSKLNNWNGVLSSGNIFSFYEIIMVLTSVWMPLILSFRFNARAVRRSNSISSIGSEVNLVFRNEKLWASLETFSRETWTVESVLFLKAVAAFKNLPNERLEAEAKDLCDRFIRGGSLYELNIDEHTREEIFERIEAKEIDKTLFNRAEKAMNVLIKEGVLPLWRNSSDYKKVIKELGIKDEIEQPAPHKKQPASKQQEMVEVIQIES